MYIKLETGNSRLGVKHETSVDHWCRDMQVLFMYYSFLVQF
jgi:hypothetical protein